MDSIGENYIQLRKFSLSNFYFAFVDVPSFMSESVFRQSKTKVKITHYGKLNNNDYIVVICKVKMEDKEKFIENMTKLQNNMMICNYQDYKDVCLEFISQFKK